MKKKITIMIAALAMVLCFAIGGTLAWLQAKSVTVVNTFTYGDINISLDETGTTLVGENKTNSYKMVPGNIIEKDPVVTVEKDSEACWLFVKVEESDNVDAFLTYAIAAGWKLYGTNSEDSAISTLNEDSYVIYRAVEATTDDAVSYNVLGCKENPAETGCTGCVMVNEGVTKAMMEGIKTSGMPTLTFTAYAVQSDNVSVEEAYGIAFPSQS